jgi:nitroreductase
MDVMEAIKSRRSVRKYTADAVSDGDIETMLDAARWAPSWANTQCVRWIVVRDTDTKSRLTDTLTPTNPARDAVRTVPVVLVACAETGRAGFKKGEAVTDKGDYWYMFDVASAAQSLMLAAVELGLATVHVGLFDAKKAEAILGVPEGIRVVELIPLGHPAEQPEGPGRKELGEIVFHEWWGQE